jgi:hypothetical protein
MKTYDREVFLKNVEWIIEHKCGGSKGRFNELIDQRQADYRWRTESNLPSLEAVIKICDIFNVNIGWLLSGHGEPDRDDVTKEELKTLVQEYKDLAMHYKQLCNKSR